MRDPLGEAGEEPVEVARGRNPARLAPRAAGYGSWPPDPPGEETNCHAPGGQEGSRADSKEHWPYSALAHRAASAGVGVVDGRGGIRRRQPSRSRVADPRGKTNPAAI